MTCSAQSPHHSFHICSDLTVCSETEWMSFPPIPPMSTPITWPTSGRSSSPTANPTPLCTLTFSPQRHQKTTATTTPSQSESTHALSEDEDESNDRWAFLFLYFSGCHLRERAARENFIIQVKTQRQVGQSVHLRFKCPFTCSFKYKCLPRFSAQTTHPPGTSQWGRTERRWEIITHSVGSDAQWLVWAMETQLFSLQFPYVPDHPDSQSQHSSSAADRLVQEVREEIWLTSNTCLMNSLLSAGSVLTSATNGWEPAVFSGRLSSWTGAMTLVEPCLSSLSLNLLWICHRPPGSGQRGSGFFGQRPRLCVPDQEGDGGSHAHHPGWHGERGPGHPQPTPRPHPASQKEAPPSRLSSSGNWPGSADIHPARSSCEEKETPGTHNSLLSGVVWV